MSISIFIEDIESLPLVRIGNLSQLQMDIMHVLRLGFFGWVNVMEYNYSACIAIGHDIPGYVNRALKGLTS